MRTLLFLILLYSGDAHAQSVDLGPTFSTGGGGGGGSVTSVGLLLPASVFTVSNSPITTSGDISATFNTQTTNKVFASPNGSTGVPTFRSLVAADIPSLSYANTALSNLASTAVNTDILPVSNLSKKLGDTSLAWNAIYTQELVSPDSTGLSVHSPDLPGGSNGIAIYSGAVSTSGDSGPFQLNSGNNDGPGDTGNVDIFSGSAATGSSGRVTISTGVAGSSRGRIQLVDGSQGTTGHVWTSTDGGGTGAWEALGTGAFTTGSIPFMGASALTENNTDFNWDNSSKSLNIVGIINESVSATDSGADGGVFSATSNTTIDGSNTTIGINGVAMATVQSGATNDKEVGGMNFVVTRGDGNDDGNLSAMTGANVLMFMNSGAAGTIDNVYGFSTLFFSTQGTATNLYDFFSQRVPSGSGVVTNHYGVYIANDSATPVKNWLSGSTQIGGSSLSLAAGAALDIHGHYVTSQSTAPTATVQASAGTGATCSVVSGTDTDGQVTISTGTIGLSTGDYCDVNFDSAYTNAPICVLTPASSAISTNVYVTSTTSAITVNFAVAGGITTTYILNYHCGGI